MSNQENTDHDNMNVADVDLDINEISNFISSNENEYCTNVALNDQTKPIIPNKSVYMRVGRTEEQVILSLYVKIVREYSIIKKLVSHKIKA